MNQSPKKRSEPAKKIGGGSLPLATASSPAAAVSSATPSNGGHPASQGSNDRLDSRTPFGSRNAPGKKISTKQDELYLQDIWPEFQLATRCTVKSSTRIFQKEYVESGIPFMRSKDIIDKALGQFSKFEMFISNDRYQEIKATYGSPKCGDLLLSSVGNRSGIPYVVQNEGDFYFKDGNIIWLSNFKNIDSNYLAYWIKSDVGQDKLASVMIGSAQKALTIDSIRKLWLRLPLFEVQKSIARILGSLDNKIESNRRINQTLEAMAQALFQSWFVDFDPVKAKQQILEAGGTARNAELAAMQIISGKNPHQLKTYQQTQPQQYAELEHTAKLFPNRLVESELGLVPEGWEYQRAEKIADIGIGKTPPRNESQWFSTNSDDIKWASIRDMGESGAYIIDTHERLTAASVEKFNVRRIPQNTLLLSFKMTVGRVAITTEEMLSNEAIAHFNLNAKSSIGTEYLYLYLKSFDYNSLGSTSSIATAVNSKTIKEMTVLVPTSSVSNRFEMEMKPLFDEMLVRQKENSSLIETRDSLLPKLLSGEIDVSSLEINS